MDMNLKRTFEELWRKYFAAAELPIVFYYTDDETVGRRAAADASNRCLVANLVRVRKGEALRFDAGSIGCPGGRRYTGFSDALQPGFEHFLSCGIPGKMEGERYKKTPELVRELLARSPVFKAPAASIVFKRWDLLGPAEAPDAVVFFAVPDVLAGLFTLASFDEAESSGVIAPSRPGAARSSNTRTSREAPRRPVASSACSTPRPGPTSSRTGSSFAAPWEKFVRMVGNMEESFLTTPTWAKIRERIARAA